MRQSQTAVLERNSTYSGDFETEPFEAAWAVEARWFVQVIRSSGDIRLSLHTQVSPDGITWCDYDDTEHVVDAALVSWPVHEFGQWLRVRGSVTGAAGASVTLRIYLALKS